MVQVLVECLREHGIVVRFKKLSQADSNGRRSFAVQYFDGDEFLMSGEVEWGTTKTRDVRTLVEFTLAASLAGILRGACSEMPGFQAFDRDGNEVGGRD
jgi:hypothetical protein